MAGKTETFVLKTKKIPFGIISGAFGMVVFFATVGLALAYVVNYGIAAATSKTVTFLDSWWQVLLFIVDIISVIIALSSLVMYILKKVYVNKAESLEVNDEKA